MATPSFYDTITIDDFKTYFSMRKAFAFNTTPLWDAQTTYSTNDKVHNAFFDIYISLINNNTQPLTNSTAWQIQEYDVSVFDEFITDSFQQAKSFISVYITDLKDADLRKKTAFLLLTAHLLQLLLNERGGVQSNNAYTSGGFIASESANGVSLSYSRPETFDELTASLSTTKFGIDYLAINKMVFVPKFFTVQADNPYST